MCVVDESGGGSVIRACMPGRSRLVRDVHARLQALVPDGGDVEVSDGVGLEGEPGLEEADLVLFLTYHGVSAQVGFAHLPRKHSEQVEACATSLIGVLITIFESRSRVVQRAHEHVGDRLQAAFCRAAEQHVRSGQIDDLFRSTCYQAFLTAFENMQSLPLKDEAGFTLLAQRLRYAYELAVLSDWDFTDEPTFDAHRILLDVCGEALMMVREALFADVSFNESFSSTDHF